MNFRPFRKHQICVVHGSSNIEAEQQLRVFLLPFCDTNKRLNEVYDYLKGRYKTETRELSALKNPMKLARRYKVIIIVDSICISDEKIRILDAYLKFGGVVFSAYPSLWDGGAIVNVNTSLKECPTIKSRLRELFGIDDILAHVWVKSRMSRYNSYLINNIPQETKYEGNAIITQGGRGIEGICHIENNDVRNPVTQEKISESQITYYEYPAFLKEHKDSGIMVYATFDYFRIFRNSGLGYAMYDIIDRTLNRQKQQTSGRALKEEEVTTIRRELNLHKILIVITFASIVALWIRELNHNWFTSAIGAVGFGLLAWFGEKILKFLSEAFKKTISS